MAGAKASGRGPSMASSAMRGAGGGFRRELAGAKGISSRPGMLGHAGVRLPGGPVELRSQAVR